MANENATGFQAEQGVEPNQPQVGASSTSNNSSAQSQADAGNTNTKDKEQSNLTIEQALKVIEDLRKEQASNRNKLKAQEERQNRAEEERLKAQGEFKTLAEQREAELNAVKPRYERLAEITKARFSDETKDWPKEVKDLLPDGENVDAVALAEAIEKFRPLATRLIGQQQQERRAGLNRSPAPADRQGGPKTAEDYYKEFGARRIF